MSKWFRETPEAMAQLARERAALAASELVLEAIEECGISLDELAEKADITRAYLDMLLEGKAAFAVRRLALLLHLCGHELRLTSQKTPGECQETAGEPV